MQAGIFHPETRHRFVGSVEPPLPTIAVLEYALPVEIVLTHRIGQALDAALWHCVFQADFVPGQVECVLVTVDVPVIEITPLVHEHCDAERVPATPLVDQQLTGLYLRFVAILHADQIPDLTIG